MFFQQWILCTYSWRILYIQRSPNNNLWKCTWKDTYSIITLTYRVAKSNLDKVIKCIYLKSLSRFDLATLYMCIIIWAKLEYHHILPYTYHCMKNLSHHLYIEIIFRENREKNMNDWRDWHYQYAINYYSVGCPGNWGI